MDSRTAAHVLSRIAALLELRGESGFKARAYEAAAKILRTLDSGDLRPMLMSGELARLRGLGPATLHVVSELIETGESRYFERLRESTPHGLLDMRRIPGLTVAKIHRIHAGLGIETVDELASAADDGRLARLKGFGPRTVEKLRKGIAAARESGPLVLFPEAHAEARRLLAAVAGHADVSRAAIAGSIRRRRELIRDVDIVAACAGPPIDVARSFAQAPGVQAAAGVGTDTVSLRFVDGTLVDIICVPPDEFAVALWHATGTPAHTAEVVAIAASRGLSVGPRLVRDGGGDRVSLMEETALYAVAGLAYVAPEMREGLGEVAAARRGAVPLLIEDRDIRGVLHCHSRYSDGKATVADMAEAARRRGWGYLGISDHSQSAFYAGGMSPAQVRAQHAEIAHLNDTFSDDFRVLKGVEADILADGTLDYDAALLDTFDYVIGSVHSRFSMSAADMTARVLRALDDPHLTILAHPTGRLLLARDPYPIDMHAVLEKAGAAGVAVELNADPHRLDLDWRLLRHARDCGALVEIGPDAHSPAGLDNTDLGVGVARKGWLTPADVLNTRSADDIVALAAARRLGPR